MLRWIAFAVALLISTIHVNRLSAQIHISGSLSGVMQDTTYIVDGNLNVIYGDSLWIPAGAVFLFNGPFDLSINGHLSAVGTADDSIVFRPNDGIEAFGSIIFENGSSQNSILSYVYVTGASTSAINAYYVHIDVTHSTFDQNNANWGGGIYLSHSNIYISDCVITYNTSINNGGGIYCTGASPTITNCTIRRNRANLGGTGSGNGGGGICANHVSSPTITNCIITENYSAEDGGGISINDESHTYIANSIISSNLADSSGGGLAATVNCTLRVDSCNIDSNTAGLLGGGLCLQQSIDATVENSTVSSNRSNSHGGGIYASLSNLILRADDFDHNDALYQGGGIAAFSGLVSAHQCSFFADSAATSGGAIYIQNSELDLLSCELTENNASTEGAGIALDLVDATLRECSISGNTTAGLGGAMFVDGSTLEIVNCEINANEADQGGGLRISTSETSIDSSWIYDNVTSGAGAGIYLDENYIGRESLTTSFTLLAGNQAYGYGGAIYGNDTRISISKCTLFGNSSEVSGGSVYLSGEETVTSWECSIFAGSVGLAGIWYGSSQNNQNDIGYCNFYDNEGGNFGGSWLPPELGLINAVNANGDSCDQYYNIFLDPLMVNPSGGDYNLQEGSPCIDAGNPEYPVDPDGSIADIGLCFFNHLPVHETPSVNLPSDVSQVSNYPNPFNPSTVINYQLPSASRVTLTVFDVAGKIVRNLVDGWRSTGPHEVTFDGSNLPSGIYLIRFCTGQSTTAKKMLLIK